MVKIVEIGVNSLKRYQMVRKNVGAVGAVSFRENTVDVGSNGSAASKFGFFAPNAVTVENGTMSCTGTPSILTQDSIIF